jgi:hypothetical protein
VQALDEIDRKVLQLEMERLSLSKAAPTDRAARGRLSALEMQLATLKQEQMVRAASCLPACLPVCPAVAHAAFSWAAPVCQGGLL